MDKIAVQSGRTYDVFAPLKETGIGLRSDHYRALQDEKPDIGWIEVHPENYFGGGVPRQRLYEARALIRSASMRSGYRLARIRTWMNRIWRKSRN